MRPRWIISILSTSTEVSNKAYYTEFFVSTCKETARTSATSWFDQPLSTNGYTVKMRFPLTNKNDSTRWARVAAEYVGWVWMYPILALLCPCLINPHREGRCSSQSGSQCSLILVLIYVSLFKRAPLLTTHGEKQITLELAQHAGQTRNLDSTKRYNRIQQP